jgi:quercetin dioxygenase-like cupin family protein
MPIVDTRLLPVVERLPGWRARIFHSGSMTFAHYEFDAGAAVHEHDHLQEEVWNVIEGELEITVDGERIRAGPGMVAIAPPGARHAVLALSSGRAIIVDHPIRPEAG